MADFIKMPTLGFDMEEGTMGVWLKQVGDAVSVGDVLAEIESDKVTQELSARAAGVLLVQFSEQGDIVPVGANLGIIGAAGEDVSGMVDEGGAESSASDDSATDEPDLPEPVVTTQNLDATGEEFPANVKATPVARRIAADKGINLALVQGSGPGGRIRKADVENYVPAPSAAPVAAAVGFTPTSVPTGPETTVVPLTRVRKAIARRMTESKTTIPQFYVTAAVDMTAALALRKQINGALPEGEKVSVNDMIVKASGLALRAFPNLNASWGGDTLIMHNRVNVGTAVAVEGGLLTVVQKNTDVTPLAQVARDNRAMIGRARSGKVQPDDIQGSTFSTSNLGSYDVDNFIAIVNPPEAAILAIGSAVSTPIVRDGEITVGQIMRITCSADHRITDGAEAAQFVQQIKSILETPLKLLI